MSLWNRLNKIVLVLHFNTLDELKSYREAIKSIGLNVFESNILCIVSSKKEKDMLGDVTSVVFLNEKEFGLFGNLKNQEAQKLISNKYDAIVYMGDFSNRIDKLLKKMNPIVRIGMNTKNHECDVSLQSQSKNADHLLSFLKEMTDKLN